MKQNKMFKNCPYEAYDFLSCRECPNYQTCLIKRSKRIQKRKEKRKKEMLTTFLSGFVLLVVVVIASSLCIDIQSNAGDKKQTTQEAVETTEIVRMSVPECSNEIEEKVVTTSTTPSHTESIETGLEEISLETTEIELKETETVESKKMPILSANEPSEEYYYNISEEDKIYIAKLVYMEARGESFEGQVAVAAVVLNRYYYGGSEFNRSSILAVITQKSQFANISNVTTQMLNECPDCMNAVEAACKGWDPTRKKFENGAMYFYAPADVSGYQADIRMNIETLQIGNHNFHNDFNE